MSAVIINNKLIFQATLQRIYRNKLQLKDQLKLISPKRDTINLLEILMHPHLPRLKKEKDLTALHHQAPLYLLPLATLLRELIKKETED